MSDGVRVPLGTGLGRVKLETDPVCGMKVNPAHAPRGGLRTSCRTPAPERLLGALRETDPSAAMKVNTAGRRPTFTPARRTTPAVAAASASPPTPTTGWRTGRRSRRWASGSRRAGRDTACRERGRGRSRRVGLPDGPRGARDEARAVPDLRDGPRAAHGHPRRGEKPRARGHDAAARRRGGPHGPASPPRDGPDAARPRARPARARGGLRRAAARDARRPLGGPAVLRADVDEPAHPAPQHVHPHRPRHRRRVALQPGRGPRCRASSRRRRAATRAGWRSTSSRRR